MTATIYKTFEREDGTLGAIKTVIEVADGGLTISPMEQISDCKAQLAATDYQAIKHSEGLIPEDDYAPIKAQRQALRDRINALEDILRDGGRI